MGHSSLAVYSGRKGSKKPKLFTKFVFCLSPQFSLTMLPIDLREDNRERHRPKGIAKREGSCSQSARPWCWAHETSLLCVWCHGKLPFPGEIIRTHRFGWRSRDSGTNTRAMNVYWPRFFLNKNRVLVLRQHAPIISAFGM